MPAAIRRIHFMYGEALMSAGLSSFLTNMFVIATMHHPRISVVTAVEMPWTAYSEWMNVCSTFAPKVPIRKPRMFTMMTTAAVNSTLSPCFMHMISDRAIVSTVSRSWSSKPANRHPNATAA